MQANQNLVPRLGPDHPSGIKKVQVGCGPQNILKDWWNVDIRQFPGIDQAMDVTESWGFTELEYVYGEHFLEHLSLEGAIAFLDHAWNSLKSNGVIRLSTPSVEWILSTHFPLSEPNSQQRILSTCAINRAFHGWGHQFLYSKEFLTMLLEKLGYQNIRYCRYGESEHPSLKNIERHGGYSIVNGYPSVWIVEASRPAQRSEVERTSCLQFLKENYIQYANAEH